jgi:hypothetical protein
MLVKGVSHKIFLGFFFSMYRNRPVKKPLMVFNFFFSIINLYFRLKLDAVKMKRLWLNNVKLHFSVLISWWIF